MSKLAVVVLAAGEGTRMKSRLPKVLHPLAGRPMIQYVLDAVAELGDEKPLLVIGYGADLMRQELGDAVTYVLQEQQLGTGHAVLQTREELEGRADNTIRYDSPSWNGLKLGAFYTLDSDEDDGFGGEEDNDPYGIGASYSNGGIIAFADYQDNNGSDELHAIGDNHFIDFF